MTFIVLDQDGIAIDQSAIPPVQTERGLQVGGTTYSGMTLAVLEIAGAVPADFIGGKYSLNATADGLEPNPAYVAPAAPTPVSLPALTITAITPDAAHSATIAPDFSEVTCPAGTTLTVSASLSVPVSGTFRMPLVSSDGRERFVLVEMVGGVASFQVPLAESGLWEVTEARINRDMPAEMRMAFSGIKVYVTL